MVRWAVCLVEPLVSLQRLVHLDEALADAASADPELVSLVFAGVTADVVRTLPADDAWRTVVLLPSSANEPGATHPTSAVQAASDDPETPPECLRDPGTPSGPPGAPLEPPPTAAPVLAPCWPSGARFGTWQDGTDLVELAWGSPERDPAFVPLADELSPAAARVLVAGFISWGDAWEAARDVLELHPPETPGRPAAPLVDALRWACWRRRAYGIVPAEDVWPYESAHHWATRAFALLEQGEPPEEAEIERDIAQQRIAVR